MTKTLTMKAFIVLEGSLGYSGLLILRMPHENLDHVHYPNTDSSTRTHIFN
jgi:hypothetical protein